MELDGLAVSPGSATDKLCDVGKLLNLSEADMGTDHDATCESS